MNNCLEISHSQGLLLDTEAELYNWFAPANITKLTRGVQY